MNPDLRLGAILGQPVRDAEGRLLGRVADVVTEPDPDGRERVVTLIVTTGRWGRLLGYERPVATGPWLLERFARLVFRRGLRRIPWSQVRWPATSQGCDHSP